MVHGRHLDLHRLILAAGSPIFHRRLLHRWAQVTQLGCFQEMLHDQPHPGVRGSSSGLGLPTPKCDGSALLVRQYRLVWSRCGGALLLQAAWLRLSVLRAAGTDTAQILNLDPEPLTLKPQSDHALASQATAASQKRRVTLDKAELSPAALDAVLGFMYTERLDINTEDVEAVLQVQACNPKETGKVTYFCPFTHWALLWNALLPCGASGMLRQQLSLMLEPMHRVWCGRGVCRAGVC